MPNRPALQRGGPREEAVLEALRNGATRQAAAAAGGVSRRTFFRHMERSPAFAHDVGLAEDEAERRATNVVYSAAMGGDVKAAMFWLERRRPVEWRQQTQVDGRTTLEQEYPPEVLAMVQRYADLSTAEVEAEIRRLVWVVPVDAQPGAVIARQPGAGGEERTPNGGDAMPLLALASLAADEAPDTAPTAPEGTEVPEQQYNGRLSPPQPAEPVPPLEVRREPAPTRCPHCRGRTPGSHEEGCPVFLPDGRLRIPWAAGGGDPR